MKEPEVDRSHPLVRRHTVSLKSTLEDMLQMTIDNKAPKSAVRFSAGGGRDITFVCIISDSDGYVRAIEAYEQGRDEFAMKVANAVAENIEKNGLPAPGTALNVVLHA